MSNTLDVDHETGDEDIVREVERTFDMTVTDREAAALYTVGDLHALVVRKQTRREGPTHACLTQVAFHRIRRALMSMGADGTITPASSLPLSMLSFARSAPIRHVWAELQQRAGSTLPRREVPPALTVRGRWLGTSLSLLIVGIPVGVALAMTRYLELSVVGAICLSFIGSMACLIATSMVQSHFCATIPRRIETVGDLAREAAGCSFVELCREKGSCSPHDLWFALLAILRNVSGHDGPIDRETTFFAHTRRPAG
jgi:hypothetical protein